MSCCQPPAGGLEVLMLDLGDLARACRGPLLAEAIRSPRPADQQAGVMGTPPAAAPTDGFRLRIRTKPPGPLR